MGLFTQRKEIPMIISNLSSSSNEKYTVGSMADPSKFVTKELPPLTFGRVNAAALFGLPPYGVSMHCTGISGITSDDVVVSWSKETGIVLTSPSASLAEAESER
jgi:hypothetical protein